MTRSRVGQNGQMDETNGARTHEPSLRELTSELDGLREVTAANLKSLREILDERDRLYGERDNSRRLAVDAALMAAKDQTAASFAASEKAIVKAEDAQRSYNSSHNDLLRKMDAQISRTEVESIVKGIEERISRVDADLRGLRESRSEFGGERQGVRAVKEDVRANWTLIIAILVPTLLLVAHMLFGK